jgi:hypothetical protein
VMNMSPVVFRETYDGAGMLQYFRGELILPYTGVLRCFRPAVTSPGWITRQRNLESRQTKP